MPCPGAGGVERSYGTKLNYSAYLFVETRLLRKRTVGDLPLSSCADDDSLCAWVAIADCSGRSHDVQGAYPIDAVSAEQYLRGLAHRCALLDADPQIQ